MCDMPAQHFIAIVIVIVTQHAFKYNISPCWHIALKFFIPKC